MRVDGQLQECKYRDALTIIAKKVEVIKSKYGNDSVALSISDRYTMKKLMQLRN